MPKISAVIPTMNEEKTIGSVIEGLKTLEDIEILVVDTNSRDRTKQIASSQGARVIDQPLRGYGLAYKTGLTQASGDIIVCMDGDGTYPTDIVTTLIDLLIKDDVDFISCDRMSLRNNENYTTLHFVGNSVLNITIRSFEFVSTTRISMSSRVFKPSITLPMVFSSFIVGMTALILGMFREPNHHHRIIRF